MKKSSALLIGFILLIWNLGIYIEFFIPHFDRLLYFLPILKNSYANVCHQDQQKVLNFAIGSSLVCARCAGIYFGAFLSSTLLIMFSIKKVWDIKYLLYSALPMFADVIFHNIGFYNYNKPFALLTGFLLGSVGFIYLWIAIEKLFTEKRIKIK